jgi:hypothetical protein
MRPPLTVLLPGGRRDGSVGSLTRRAGLNPEAIRSEFVVDEMILGQAGLPIQS